VKSVAIYGAGGFAREVAWLLSSLDYDFIGYVEDDAPQGKELSGIPVFSWDVFCNSFAGVHIAVAIGDPDGRERVVNKCTEAGLSFVTLIHPSVKVSSSVEIGEGSIVCCENVLTVDIVIGRHVYINLDCTIGHDARIGDFSTLAPGVHVSGNVCIGRLVYVGTGAVIINGETGNPLKVGDKAVIGAGASVIKGVSPRSLWAGVPAVFKKPYGE